ncbi:MAG: 3-phosphoshikimate 1-carboxyvinyltransferase [Deltaproteobacteria bacterium]|nr:3-phosphoshikimate 1-carboxyvinyltransferase [Deltaproteobacteria bacterium]
MTIPCLNQPWKADICLPGSKSLTNRALLIAALARGNSKLRGVLLADDTQHMKNSLTHLGILFRQQKDTLEVTGRGGHLQPYSAPLYTGNAGTVARFLTVALNLGEGHYILDGDAEMKLRPIRDLTETLTANGCDIHHLQTNNSLPLKITARGFPGGDLHISGKNSSQYISALMMAAPFAHKPVTIRIKGPPVSSSYIHMTRQIMTEFGAICHHDSENILHIARGGYQGRSYDIEGDASSASYLFAAAAITGGEANVRGLSSGSSQGDLGFLQLLQQMGCDIEHKGNTMCVRGKGSRLNAIQVDMNSMSDIVPTLAVTALFARGTTVIRNVANMRIKECDRITAIVTELRKTGASVEEFEDGLAVTGEQSLGPALLETWKDHRMAMALSLIGLRIPGIRLTNPGCVSKTFPEFFEMLKQGYQNCQDIWSD